MARRHLLFAAAIAALPLPAAASVVVMGSANARMCFLAAESRAHPDRADLQRCDDAVIKSGRTPHILVATHVNRGILRLRRGDVDGAMADFNAATRLNPDEPEAYLNRASALLRNAQVANAITEFDTAIAKNTRRPELAYYGRAIAHEESGNIRAAYHDYVRASELAPRWGEPRAELTRFRVAQ